MEQSVAFDHACAEIDSPAMTGKVSWLRQCITAVEARLAIDRHQIPHWLPVMMGSGIACWFALPLQTDWIAAALVFCAISALGAAIGHASLLGRALIIAGLAATIGLAVTWWRAEQLATPVLSTPMVATFDAQVIRGEFRASTGQFRYLLAPITRPDLPPRLRANQRLTNDDAIIPFGSLIRVRARLMPPAPAALPGGYDFARTAWFQQIGATGTMLEPPIILRSPDPSRFHDGFATWRALLTAHIASRLPLAEAGVAIALATGSASHLPEADAEAMRRSGLAHLLSVSGLHITAVVGATILLTTSLLALSRRIALRVPLPLVGAGFAAIAAIAYTMLTGADVPAVRACIAALLILTGMALGRRALSMRLAITGALVIMLLWPETVIGPSFQMSFAAIIAIIALHEYPPVRALLTRREEAWFRRTMRALTGLVLTGLAVEIMLTPVILYHFHRAGLYGSVANIIAIPLTTFVVMPLEGLALLFDIIGWGGPFWLGCGWAIGMLLKIAHGVSALPGSTLLLPTLPMSAFALMGAGGLWLAIWHGRWRWWGFGPIAAGLTLAWLAPAPDLLATRDGRHALLRLDDGTVVLLRSRAGDYIRDMLSETAGIEPDRLAAIEDRPEIDCSRDSCTARLHRTDRHWTIGFVRSDVLLPWQVMIRWCSQVDIVIAPRALPDRCTPRWQKWDRPALNRMGGATLSMSPPAIQVGTSTQSDHPWHVAAMRASLKLSSSP